MRRYLSSYRVSKFPEVSTLTRPPPRRPFQSRRSSSHSCRVSLASSIIRLPWRTSRISETRQSYAKYPHRRFTPTENAANALGSQTSRRSRELHEPFLVLLPVGLAIIEKFEARREREREREYSSYSQWQRARNDFYFHEFRDAYPIGEFVLILEG